MKALMLVLTLVTLNAATSFAQQVGIPAARQTRMQRVMACEQNGSAYDNQGQLVAYIDAVRAGGLPQSEKQSCFTYLLMQTHSFTFVSTTVVQIAAQQLASPAYAGQSTVNIIVGNSALE